MIPQKILTVLMAVGLVLIVSGLIVSRRLRESPLLATAPVVEPFHGVPNLYQWALSHGDTAVVPNLNIPTGDSVWCGWNDVYPSAYQAITPDRYFGYRPCDTVIVFRKDSFAVICADPKHPVFIQLTSHEQ